MKIAGNSENTVQKYKKNFEIGNTNNNYKRARVNHLHSSSFFTRKRIKRIFFVWLFCRHRDFPTRTWGRTESAFPFFNNNNDVSEHFQKNILRSVSSTLDLAECRRGKISSWKKAFKDNKRWKDNSYFGRKEIMLFEWVAS